MGGNPTEVPPQPAEDVDGQMGFGQKQDPVQVFERAVDAAQELLDSLKKLNPIIPDKNDTLDINKVTKQVQNIMTNLESLAARLDGSSPPVGDQFEPGQTNQSIS